MARCHCIQNGPEWPHFKKKMLLNFWKAEVTQYTPLALRCPKLIPVSMTNPPLWIWPGMASQTFEKGLSLRPYVLRLGTLIFLSFQLLAILFSWKNTEVLWVQTPLSLGICSWTFTKCGSSSKGSCWGLRIDKTHAQSLSYTMFSLPALP